MLFIRKGERETGAYEEEEERDGFDRPGQDWITLKSRIHRLQASPVFPLFVLSFSLHCRSSSLCFAHLDQRHLDEMISPK